LVFLGKKYSFCNFVVFFWKHTTDFSSVFDQGSKTNDFEFFSLLKDF